MVDTLPTTLTGEFTGFLVAINSILTYLYKYHIYHPCATLFEGSISDNHMNSHQSIPWILRSLGLYVGYSSKKYFSGWP